MLYPKPALCPTMVGPLWTLETKGPGRSKGLMLTPLLKGLQISVTWVLPCAPWVLLPSWPQADHVSSLSTDRLAQQNPNPLPPSGRTGYPSLVHIRLPTDPHISWSREEEVLPVDCRAETPRVIFLLESSTKHSLLSQSIRNKSFLHNHNLNNFKTRNALASLLQM